MFSHACIFSIVHGQGVCMAKGVCVMKGACMAKGGVHDERGTCLAGGVWQGAIHGG